MNQATWKLTDRRYESHHFHTEINKRLSGLRADNFTGALYIMKDYFVIVSCGFITLNYSWWFYPLAVLIISAHQRGLTTIAHDAAHRTLAKNAILNYFLGTIFGSYPLFQRHWAYRISHVHLHHPFLGNPQKDPDLMFFMQSGIYDVCHPFRYFLNIVIFPIFGGATLDYLKYLITTRFRVVDEGDGNGAKNSDQTKFLIDGIGFYFFWILVALVGYWNMWLDEIILFWIIPYLTTFQILGWFIEIAEHSPMCESESENIFLTRNRKGNLVERLLFGVNLDEYHLEHHLSPGVPFWKLKVAQEIRRLDPRYDSIAKTWGGLFCSGPQGQPSVIALLLERNERLYWSQKYTDNHNTTTDART